MPNPKALIRHLLPQKPGDTLCNSFASRQCSLRPPQALGQTAGFLKILCCLRGMTVKLMKFGHMPVGFGLSGPQVRRLLEIMKGFGILSGGLTFLSQSENGAVEQVRRR
jgi:hypothetical protein